MMNFGLVIIFLVLLTHEMFTDSRVKYLEKRKCQFNKSNAPRCHSFMRQHSCFPLESFNLQITFVLYCLNVEEQVLD